MGLQIKDFTVTVPIVDRKRRSGFAMLTKRGQGDDGYHVILATTQSARDAKSRICRTA